MIPPSTGTAPTRGYSFYRDQDNSFTCPINGCGQAFAAPEDLQSHIRKGHTFQQTPDGAIRSKMASSANNDLLQGPSSGLPAVRRVSQPQQQGQSSPHTPPYNGQMLPPANNAPPSITETGSQLQKQPLSWVETTRWPEKTAQFLKQLIHTHELYTNPISPQDQYKLYAIFSEFYEKTEFRTYKPPKDDKRLWQLFRAKLEQVQTEMRIQGEAFKRKIGNDMRRVLPSTQVSTSMKTPESLSTPPVTPIMGSDKVCDGIELWNGLDVDAQAALFRQQLRNAKNRKGLMLEWNEYCVEIKEKNAARTRDHKSATPSAQSSGSKTPPPPSASESVARGPIDVRGIMARKTQQLQMKKDNELLRAVEERASKRLKVDSM
ncbi:hypothetical protein VTL71DRAFT_16406 [Oculimacula yallundae]|uniref:C2H2-type domain-containing protein n=1 Tax=Oculimacula yallundae TaxID=86028 RepID=A0ABR4CEI7_9HELO